MTATTSTVPGTDPAREQVESIRDVESVNVLTNGEWVASFPLEVRLAIASAEDRGVGVADDRSRDALFYEASADYLACSSNVGASCGAATDGLRKHLERYRVPAEDVSTLVGFVRLHAMASGAYPEPLARLMRFVGQDETVLDDWSDE